jgi:raffinose/stachyose/melibiose transport system substrate-binding protein
MRNVVRRRPVLAIAAVAAVAALAVGIAGTARGNSNAHVGAGAAVDSVPPQKQAAKQVGNITLTILDQELTPAGKVEFPQLIASFQKQYSNIKVKRLTKDFTSLTSNETLLLAGSHVPDAVETDESYANQGRLAKAKLLVPLDKYVKAWGWKKRTSAGLLACCRVQPTGKGLGTGPFYGFPANAQYVGVYYNARLLRKLGLKPPSTKAEFEAALAKAKAKGIVPIIGSGADHDLVWWGFYAAMGMNAPADQIRQALLGQGTKGFDTPQMVAAAAQLASWGKKGYFQPGFSGVTSDSTTVDFNKGKGLFYFEGTWDLGAFKDNPDIGFMPEPAMNAGAPRTGIDAAGQPWGIPSKGQHELAAALWIDWISNPIHFKTFVNAGDLPIGPIDTSKMKLAKVVRDGLAAGGYMTKNNTSLPFFWAIPGAQNYWQGAGAGILSGHVSPQDFVKGMQSSWKQDVAQYGGSK